MTRSECSIPPAPGIRLEVPSCNLCHGTSTEVVVANARDRLHALPGCFNIVRCTRCGLSYTAPRPVAEDIGFYYPVEYYTHAGREEPTLIRNAKAFGKALMYAPRRARYGTPVEEWSPFGAGAALDIGCGNGRFLANLRRRGWQVVGLDADPAAIASTQKVVADAQLHCGRFEEVDLSNRLFSLVMMSHVLEHAHDPVEFLRRALNLVEPGGKLIVRVPNFGSRQARLFGSYWRGIEMPRHLFHFTPTTLTALLTTAGYKVAAVRPQTLPMSISQSLCCLLEDRLPPFAGRTRNLEGFLYSMLYPGAVFASFLGEWDAIEAIAVNNHTPIASSADLMPHPDICGCPGH